MPKTDPRVDAYIAKAQPFAQPVMTHLRKLVHKVCPDVEETIKWGFTAFDYKGPFCTMASFKAHCAFGFWKNKLIPDPEGILSRDSMGSLGKITGMKDLPSDKVLTGFLKAAMKLNEDGVKLPKPKKSATPKMLVIPDYVTKALKKDKKAFATFEAFAPSHRKEYVEWITEAKTEETRNKRIASMMELLAEGKSRNWKYQRK